MKIFIIVAGFLIALIGLFVLFYAIKKKSQLKIKWVTISVIPIVLLSLSISFMSVFLIRSYPIMIDETSLILHAGGTIKVDGKEYIYTNTIEPFDEAYEKGFRYFEYDFALSSDGKIIGLHDYGYLNKYISTSYSDKNPISYDEYVNSKILGLYSGVTIQNVTEKLRENQDSYIVFDIKDWKNYNTFFTTFVEELESLNSYDLIERFIPQVYSYEMYNYMNENFDFAKYIYTNYMSLYDASRIVECFKGKENVIAITIPAHSKLMVRKLIDNGFKVYMHTINKYSTVVDLAGDYGVSGFYTDNRNLYKNIENKKN